jgi:hypothetical protein
MSKIFKKLFCPKLPKRGVKRFSISNIDRFEKKIWSLPFQPLLDFPDLSTFGTYYYLFAL